MNDAGQSGLIIAGGTTITVDPDSSVYDQAWIEIRGNRIERISPSPIEPGPGDRVVDATGKVVMPGLVNAHTHLWQTLIRGVYELIPFKEWLAAIYACGDALTVQDCQVSALLGGVESLHSGVTTVVDHQFLHRGSELAEAAISGMLEAGVRSVAARTIMDGGEIVPDSMCETPAAGLRSVEELIEAHAEHRASGILTIMTGPNTPGLSASLDLALSTIGFCADNDIRQSMHIAESKTLRPLIKEWHGYDGVVQWLAAHDAIGPQTLAAHCVDLDDTDVATFAERGVSVSHNPVCNLFMADGIAPVAEMLAAGVNVGMGTDGAASNNSQDMLEVLKFGSLLQRVRTDRADVIPPLRAVRMATLDGARAAGVDHLVGSLEAGKRADLVVLDLRAGAHNVAVHDPVSAVVHTARPTDVQMVLVDGQVVLDDGHVVGVDETDLLQRAQRVGTALVQRLP